MQLKKYVLIGALTASLALGSLVFGMEWETKTEKPKSVEKTEYEAKKKDYEAQKKELAQQKETQMAEKQKMAAEMEAKIKEIKAAYEAAKKQLMADFEVSKQALYDEWNALSAEEQKTRKAEFDEKKKQLMADLETKKKTIQAKFETSMQAVRWEMETKKKEVETKKTEFEGKKKEMEAKKDVAKKEIEEKIKQTKAQNDVCKTQFATIRTEAESNMKARKAAWDAFWEANKWIQKDLYVAEYRDDVKDTLDTMRLQIRLVERKYARSLVGTGSTGQSLDYALNLINTIVDRSRDSLSEYVQEGKTDQFTTFRDWFKSVLISNKTSLLTMMQTHAQTIKSATWTCKKRAQLMFAQQDTVDRQAQWQMKSESLPSWEKAGKESKAERKSETIK